MRFDSTLFYHVGEPFDWSQLMDEMRETVTLLDELGYTGVWLAEHHFAWDGWYRSASNPILLGADVMRTSDRLRVGQCGVVLADWHPIRVAEDISFLDQLSKGRVDFGIAPGINTRACTQFHPVADRRDRAGNRKLFEECLEVILKAMTEEAFTHDGEFFKFPASEWMESNPLVHDERYHAEDGQLLRLGVFPKPYQKPHPPIFSMSESPSSIEYCAQRGITPMSQTISVGRLRENWELYRDVATEAHGRPFALGEGVALMRNVYVAETEEEALRDTREGSNLLSTWGSGNLYRMRSAMVTAEEMEDGDEDLDWFDFQVKHGTLLIGSPDSVAEKIERLYSELNCRHLALFLNIPLLTFDQVKRSLRLFAEEVMPRFTNRRH